MEDSRAGAKRYKMFLENLVQESKEVHQEGRQYVDRTQ